MRPRRWRIRPDRLRQARGFRRAADAQERSEEMGAKLSKHRQERFVTADDEDMHVASHNARRLTGRSDRTATTPKIVSDRLAEHEAWENE